MTTADDDAFDLDMAAATLQSNSSDVRIMLNALAAQLGEALSDRLAVERAGGRFRKSADVKSLQVTLGDDVLRAEADGPTLRCTVEHRSGGIRIRSQQVETGDWLKRLLDALHQEAAHSETARQALENLVIGGDK
jgi:hypothetical protein